MYSSAGEDSGVRACPGSRSSTANPQRSGGTSGFLGIISPYSPAWFTRTSSRHWRPCPNIRHLQPRETKGPVSFPDREGCSSRAPSPPLSLIFHPGPPEGGIAMGTYSLLLAGRYSPGSDPKSCGGPSHTLYQPRSGTRGGARRSAPSLPSPPVPRPRARGGPPQAGFRASAWRLASLRFAIRWLALQTQLPSDTGLLERSELQFHVLWNFLFTHFMVFSWSQLCTETIKLNKQAG